MGRCGGIAWLAFLAAQRLRSIIALCALFYYCCFLLNHSNMKRYCGNCGYADGAAFSSPLYVAVSFCFISYTKSWWWSLLAGIVLRSHVPFTGCGTGHSNVPLCGSEFLVPSCTDQFNCDCVLQRRKLPNTCSARLISWWWIIITSPLFTRNTVYRLFILFLCPTL